MNILFDVFTFEGYLERYGLARISVGYLELFGFEPSFRGSLFAFELDWGPDAEHLFDGDIFYIRGLLRYFRARRDLNG